MKILYLWAYLWITPSQSKRLPGLPGSVNSGATIWSLPEKDVPTEHFVTDGVLQIQSWCVVIRAGKSFSSSLVHLPLGSGNILRHWWAYAVPERVDSTNKGTFYGIGFLFTFYWKFHDKTQLDKIC